MAETALQKTYKDKAVTQQNALPAVIVDTLGTLMPQIPALLPSDITTEQFRAALYLELSGRPQLAECTRDSLRDAVIKAAMHGLLPGRDCHFLPFKNTRANNRVATYVPNYLGIILALERSGKVRRAFAHPVYEGDVWGFDYFADRPVHKPAASLGQPQGKVLFYYGAILLKDNTCHFEVLTLKDIDAVRLRSPAHDGGPWVTDPVMMARKTALKRVAKYVKLTEAMQTLLDDDEAREREDIPDARHRQNIIDLFGEGEGAAVTAGTPRPQLPTDEEDGPQVLARLLTARQGDVEAWYVWAERKYRKTRTAFTLADWDDFLQAVRREVGKEASHGVLATRSGTKAATAPAVPATALEAQGAPKNGPAEEAPFVDPETGEILTPGYGMGASWAPENPNLVVEDEAMEAPRD